MDLSSSELDGTGSILNAHWVHNVVSFECYISYVETQGSNVQFQDWIFVEFPMPFKVQ